MQYNTKQKRLIVLKTFLVEMAENGFHFKIYDPNKSAVGSTMDVKREISLSHGENEDVISIFLRNENLDKANSAAKKLLTEYREENPDSEFIKLGVVQLVYGDKGEDVIASYNVELEQFMTKTLGVIGSLSKGTYVHTPNEADTVPSL